MRHLRLFTSSGVDERRKQIKIRAIPLRDVHETIYAATSQLNIPQDAIFINVGCEYAEPPSLYPRVSPEESFLSSIEVSWDLPQQVSYGETVPLKLTLENTSDKTVGLILGGGLPYDFVVSTAGGESIWNWGCARIATAGLPGKSLEPGEKLEFVGEWQQVDIHGEPVASGNYQVYGMMYIGTYDEPRKDVHQLETKPHPIQILPTSATIAPPKPTPSPTPTETATSLTSGRESQFTETEYSADQLNAWRDALQDIVWDVPGFAGLLVGAEWNPKGKERIWISAYALRGVREAMETALLKVDVPRDAVVLDIGCEFRGQWPRRTKNALPETPQRKVDFSLDIPTQVPYGEAVTMKLTLENVGDETVGFFLAGSPAYDFTISTPDQKGVWFWGCGQPRLAALFGQHLQPGEKIEFVEEWQQVNVRAEPVAPGIYIVHGFIEIGILTFNTEPRRVEILPP